MFRVANLSVDYLSERRGKVPALVDVSFSIREGEAVGLLGDSGCGKTTTALSILRLLPVAGRIIGGAIYFKGRNLLELPVRDMDRIRGAEISLVFQEPSIALNPVMKVGDQIAEVVHAHRSWSWKRCRRKAVELLERVCLAESGSLYHGFPHELSGGQRQRVLIAEAIACDPALVIADEPTTGLDGRTQSEILALLCDLKIRSRTSFLFISHNFEVLDRLADRLLVMHAGRIVEERSFAQACLQKTRNETQKSVEPALLADFGVRSKEHAN